MSNQTVQGNQHSGSWIAFTYASFFGALGSFGFAYTQPEAMQRAADEVRARTEGDRDRVRIVVFRFEHGRIRSRVAVAAPRTTGDDDDSLVIGAV